MSGGMSRTVEAPDQLGIESEQVCLAGGQVFGPALEAQNRV